MAENMLAEVAGPDQSAVKNKAWALYKKNPSGVFWVDLSRDRYTPAGNTSGRGLLFT